MPQIPIWEHLNFRPFGDVALEMESVKALWFALQV